MFAHGVASGDGVGLVPLTAALEAGCRDEYAEQQGAGVQEAQLYEFAPASCA